MEQRVQVSYFGYTAEFTTTNNRNDDIRAEANRIIIDKFGTSPKLHYVEPGLPFPNFVPVLRYDHEDQKFY